MKDFFSNKVNVVLTAVLLIACSIAAYFTIQLFSGNKVTAIDFVGKSEEEVRIWIKENELSDDLVRFVYEYDDVFEKGIVSYQNIRADEVIRETVTFTVSKGADPDWTLDLTSYIGSLNDQLQRYLVDKHFTSIEIRYDADSDLPTDTVIAIDPLIASRNEKVTVLVSGKDENEKGGEDEKTDKVTIPGDLLGLSESEFIRKINGLGFANVRKSSTAYYSDNMASGTVYSYDDGLFDTARTINYALCAGKADVSAIAGELKGLTLSKAKSVVDSYNNRNARVTVKFSSNSGTVDSCSVSGKEISCTMSGSDKTAVIPGNLLKKSESEFLNIIKGLGFTQISCSDTTYFSETIAKDTIFSYDDGEMKLSDTVEYALSQGPADISAIANELKGLSQSDAKSRIEAYNRRNARLSVSFSGSGAVVDSCTVNARAISCRLSGDTPSSATAVIPDNLLGKSESEFLDIVKKLGFSKFSKESETYFSTTLKKDTIFSYDDGKMNTADTVKYALCAGPADISAIANELKGLSQSDAKSRIEAYNRRNARLTISFSGSGSSVENCSVSERSISCRLSSSTPDIPSATIPGNLIGKTESDFLATVKKLGFSSFSKDSVTYYSTTLSKGTVFSYDDGTFKTNTVIAYALSEGPLNVSSVASELNGKTRSQAEDTVKAYNARNGRITLNIGSEVESSQSAGTLLNCKASDRTISCNVAKSQSAPVDNRVDLRNYVGSESPCGSSSSCTVSDIRFSVTFEYSSKAEGTVISQSVAAGKVEKGTSVSLTVSKGQEPVATGYVPTASMLNSSYSGSTVEETWNSVSAMLRNTGFSSVTYTEQLSTSSLKTGTVIRVEVNGKSASGNFPLDSKINVVICSGQQN